MRTSCLRRAGRLAGWLLVAAVAGAHADAVPAEATPAGNFLPVDQAFRLSTGAAPDGGLAAHFDITPGYHLYRERIDVSGLPQSVRLGPLNLPEGTVVHDANFDRDMQIYTGQLDLHVALQGAAAAPALVRLNYQGCAEAGLCYPPQERDLRLSFDAGGRVVAVAAASDAEVAAAEAQEQPQGQAQEQAPPAGTPGDGNSRIRSALASGHLLTIAGVFLVAGLLLSLTPCVLPMVPILSSIIVGDRKAATRRRGFALSLAYALGMMLVYTVFGVVAGLLGEGLAASLQNPWVLGAFALLLGALALSMFGVYQLQMPSAVQNRVAAASGKLRGGSYAGVFVMGGLSALIVGPCVAAPLAGALVYISQTRDVVIGGLALLSLAAGMSVPLLLVGLSAGSLLPRAGRWMESVKTLMGVILLAVAWWLVSPVLPAAASMLLLAALLALGAALLGAFSVLPPQAGFGQLAGKALGWLLACVSVLQLVGALSGGSSPWRPLQPFAGRTGSVAEAAPSAPLPFRRIGSVAELDSALQQAAGRPVVLDFYADWCVACKELEERTFADPRVQQRAVRAVLLQADVTANGEAQKALLRRFGLFGPPGVLFFDARGPELSAARVIGFTDADSFLRSLQAAGL